MVARRSEQFKRQKTRKRSRFPDIFTTVDLQLDGQDGRGKRRAQLEVEERDGEARETPGKGSGTKASSKPQVVHAT